MSQHEVGREGVYRSVHLSRGVWRACSEMSTRDGEKTNWSGAEWPWWTKEERMCVPVVLGMKVYTGDMQ